MSGDVIINISDQGEAVRSLMDGLHAMSTDAYNRIADLLKNTSLDPDAIAVFRKRDLARIPVGSRLHFDLVGVDDEARLTYAGFGRTVGLNNPIKEVKNEIYPVQ